MVMDPTTGEDQKQIRPDVNITWDWEGTAPNRKLILKLHSPKAKRQNKMLFQKKSFVSKFGPDKVEIVNL